ncbi:MAG: DUF2490 domain-containing protein [Cytophagaceae bacterium]
MKRALTISLLLLCAAQIQAQHYNDARLWLSGNVQKKLSNKFSANFTESVRMYENYTQLGQVYSDFGLRYKISKNWRVAGHVRLSKNRKNQETFTSRIRFYADVAYKQKAGKFLDFVFRARYQSQYTDYNRSKNGHSPSNHLRLKTTMNFDLNKRYTPYLAGELFFQRSYSDNKNRFDQTRFSAGLLYDIDKKNQVDVHYMVNTNFNNNNQGARYYVLSLNYYYSF